MSSNPVGLVHEVLFRSEEFRGLGRADSKSRTNGGNPPLVFFQEIQDMRSQGEKALVFGGNMESGGGKKRCEIPGKQERYRGRLAQFEAYIPPEPSERPGLVFVLRTTVFGNGNQTRREMPKPDCGTGFVPLLSARSAGPIGVDLALAKEEFVLPGQPKLSLPGIQASGFQGLDL